MLLLVPNVDQKYLIFIVAGIAIPSQIVLIVAPG